MIETLPGLLRAAADRFPTHVALRNAERSLTYGELIGTVYQMANYLLGAGCATGDWVVCCLPRGIEAVVLQAAVMAAGAVYMPIDTKYPPMLLREMLRSERPLRIIGDAPGVAACRAATADVIGIVLDDNTYRVINTYSTTEPLVKLSSRDGAYVIHTSGSSGVPKAVLVSHGAITLSTMARWERYPDRVTGFLLVSPLFFDSSLAGIWWTLSQGGALEPAPPDAAAVIACIRRALMNPRSELSHTLLTPTLYTQVLERLQDPAPALRHIIVAGEVCTSNLVSRHYSLLPEVELANEYGPTEAAVWCTSTVLRPDLEVTIGFALPGVELLVLDPDGQTVPQGTEGELCIAGDQLAEGYPRDSKLTTDRFVPHPYRPTQRLYRTGDRACMRPDGQYAVAGRFDEQIKIRGFRVDLDGVRMRLIEHPGIADLALALRDRPGTVGQVLTAYIVPLSERVEAQSRLRRAWTQVVDEVAIKAPASGTDFDVSGWNSSYTGHSFPVEAMTEWVDSTVALLREGEPSTVLDLGCGSGLPLLRIAPSCRRYVGLDVSVPTLAGLKQSITRDGLQNVELQLGEAADITRFAGQQFDLIVSNSVSQYFPDADYLKSLIQSGLGCLAPHGRMVIGDVRDLTLLWEFHTTVALYRLPPQTLAAKVWEQVQERANQEAQLLISPLWFAALSHQLPGIEVELRPRRGWNRNEMNDFRFDALLHAAGSVTRVDVPRWLIWSEDVDSLDNLEAFLPFLSEPLGIRRMPNARTAGASAVVAHLRSHVPATIAELIQLRDSKDNEAVHPEAVIQLASRHRCEAYFDRGGAHDAGALDVVFLPKHLGASSGKYLIPQFVRAVPTAAPLTSNPTAHRAVLEAPFNLIPQLKLHAEQVLAPQERPGAYVILPVLPLTSRDKLDLAALPAPKLESQRPQTSFVKPSTATEIAVAAVWSRELGINQIGIDDDFIEIGGDSLMAAVCSVEICERLGADLPAGVIFSNPTVRMLATFIDRSVRPLQSSPPHKPAIVDGDALPLTSAQTVFWFLDHYRRPGSSRHADFALSVHYRITGPLDDQALSAAIDQLVVRHEALRTRVLLGAEEGYQVLLSPSTGVLSTSFIDNADIETTFRLAALDDTSDPLDPALGKVFTAQLVSASSTEHLLMLRLHHIVSDGWSVNVLEADLERLYHAAQTNALHLLKPPPSYQSLTRLIDRTFFVDLDWRDMEPYRTALTYWQKKVIGIEPTVLQGLASSDLHQPTEQHSVDLSDEELAPLLHKARQQGATLFSTIVAALACLRAQGGDNSDVRLLTLNAARDTAGVDQMIGLLLNPVLLRLQSEMDETFDEMLPRAAREVREALSHGQVPLLAMCEEIPELMTFMTESQFVGVELLSPARGLYLAGCDIRRTDGFDDDFLGRRFELPIELLLVVRRNAASVRLTILHDPAVFSIGAARSLLENLKQTLLTSTQIEVHA